MTVTVKGSGKIIEIVFADCVGASEKQAEYANSCKSKVFTSFAILGGLYDKITEKYFNEIESLKTNTDARFWIDNQGVTIQTMIKNIIDATK